MNAEISRVAGVALVTVIIAAIAGASLYAGFVIDSGGPDKIIVESPAVAPTSEFAHEIVIDGNEYRCMGYVIHTEYIRMDDCLGYIDGTTIYVESYTTFTVDGE